MDSPGHGVDEEGGEIERPAVLAGAVVVGVRVVVVVEPLADGEEGDEPVLRGVDVDVVGAAAEHVRQGVDRPRAVQGDQVGEDAPHVRSPGVLAPEVNL